MEQFFWVKLPRALEKYQPNRVGRYKVKSLIGVVGVSWVVSGVFVFFLKMLVIVISILCEGVTILYSPFRI